MKVGALLRFLFPCLFTLLLLVFLAGCAGDQREKAIGEGYIGSPTAGLRDRLGPSWTNTATVKAGDRVEILQKRRRWVRVRTAGAGEGWLEERHIIPRETFEQAQGLVKASAGRPSQGQARARSPVNLHPEPSRKSPPFFQLQEGETCDVVEHRAVEVPLPPGAQPVRTEPAQPGKQPAVEQPAAKQPAGKQASASGKKGKHKAKLAKLSGPKKEDWFLLRAKGKAGWALARMVEMSIPDEVAQYAEGKAITAWHVLGEVPDGGQRKAQYIWATSEQVGSPYDFDGIRVFIWNKVRHRYETSYRERNRQGVYPIVVGKVQLKSGEFPAFSIITVDDEGNRTTRNFVLLGNIVRRREQVE